MELSNEVKELVRTAYYMGQHVGAKRACDKASGIIKEQQARAEQEHCHLVAKRVQGGVDYVYDPDYSSDFSPENAEHDETLKQVLSIVV